jgi:hypothetical protein
MRTNGYHPLWMMAVTLLRLIAGGTGIGFFALLFATLAACAMAATIQLALLFRRQSQTPAAAGFATLMFAVGCAGISRTGMEVALALPLSLAHIAELDRGARSGSLRWRRLGILAALSILARVDMAILVALTWAAVLPPLVKRTGTRHALMALAPGGSLLFCYFTGNLIIFGSLLPISADAKALSYWPLFNVGVLREIFWPPHVGLLQWAVYPIPGWCVLAVGLAGLARWRGLDGPARLVTAICVFPPVLYLTLALRSDWLLWFWYLYPVVLATPFALVWLLKRCELTGVTGTAAGTVIAALVMIADCKTEIADGHYVRGAAMAMLPFTASHPGRYAMGDRAGLTSFVTRRTMLQLEGIVGNQALLSRIRAGADLMQVLQDYNIDYYIATDVPSHGPCFAAREPKPAQAGPRSPALTAKCCATPLYRQADDGAGLETLIFAVPCR